MVQKDYDVVVIGGGIVGLATAHQIQIKDPNLNILILEKEERLAAHQTGHNSGVIHSGLYYKPGSLKAQNCIRGYHMLLDFCNTHEVNYEICGKIVVATEERELASLETLYERGNANGLTGLRYVGQEEMREVEPHVNGIRGIFVPQTGIIDYTEVTNAYAKALHQDVHLGEKVMEIKDHTVVTDKSSYTARLIINCAGLYSDKVAGMGQQEPDLRIIPFRGEYYELVPERQHLVRNLIYPVPDPNFPFLGVHFTRMIHGGVEAGPNAVLAFRREGYDRTSFHAGEFMEIMRWPGFRKVAAKYYKTGLGEIYRSFSKHAFVKALQKLIPEIQAQDLVDGGAGVRAQACHRDGNLLDDFFILEDNKRIDVCNAPSPAATSSLSIGETVATMALDHLTSAR